ncbi:UPF0398 protein [Philodulcilactobacillus myokoensis]|uniref:UPF0398 protein WR164_08250 n=1 Tax=Philodulcilactobacillus myokoensis TaxID=2929573 RepID=A0A9W6B1K2_9LACO|nr:DUF1273 domain-containing protein [Philodulcilactobacillus myokoensis]GLB46846.1 UPF0398 protein [Philodulcilactobacillus myokoensis]
MKRLWITGYRSYELGIFNDKDPKLKVINQVIKQNLIQAIESGVDWIITGPQLGIEQLSVQQAVKLKQKYPNEFKVAVMSPFKNVQKRWNQNNKLKLSKIIQNADFADSVSHKEYNSPSQLINYQRFMLSHTDEAIMIYDPDHEGKSKYDYHRIKTYSEQRDYPFKIIDFDDLQEAANEYEENLKK